MNLRFIFLTSVLMVFFVTSPIVATAGAATQNDEINTANEINLLDPFDPFARDAEQILKEYDREYERETGLPSHLNSNNFLFFEEGCQRESCAVFVKIEKSEQRLYLYVGGQLESVWPISTGVSGRETPNMDTHPDGRIYDAYTSKRFPGGNYNGMGNMPYAVFVKGGVAIHGTGRSNWAALGHEASHGCIRLHPDNALRFNRLVRSAGIDNVWVTIE